MCLQASIVAFLAFNKTIHKLGSIQGATQLNMS